MLRCEPPADSVVPIPSGGGYGLGHLRGRAASPRSRPEAAPPPVHRGLERWSQPPRVSGLSDRATMVERCCNLARNDRATMHNDEATMHNDRATMHNDRATPRASLRAPPPRRPARPPRPRTRAQRSPAVRPHLVAVRCISTLCSGCTNMCGGPVSEAAIRPNPSSTLTSPSSACTYPTAAMLVHLTPFCVCYRDSQRTAAIGGCMQDDGLALGYRTSAIAACASQSSSRSRCST